MLALLDIVGDGNGDRLNGGNSQGERVNRLRQCIGRSNHEVHERGKGECTDTSSFKIVQFSKVVLYRNAFSRSNDSEFALRDIGDGDGDLVN